MAPPQKPSRTLRGRNRRALLLSREDLENRLVPAAIGPTVIAAAAPADLPVISPTVTVSPQGGTGSPQGYSPQQIDTAYGFNQLSLGATAANGAGQTIAIVDAYDDPDLVDSTASNFSTSDLAEFDQEFGLPAPPSFVKLNEYGSTTDLPGTDPAGPGASSNWEQEEAMDVEWAHALAPAANIVLVEASTSSFGDLYQAIGTAANLPGVSTVSISWGSSEFAGETYWDSDFTTPAGHQGVTFIAASGDSGTPGLYPAYAPDVLAVGGTALFTDDSGDYQSEDAWASSGGGPSAYETEPAYQDSVQDTGSRTIPDVAFDADRNTGVAVYDSYDNTGSGPWRDMGGTSLGVPAWAAIVALADQARAAAGATTLDGATQTLPALYSLPSADFHDITTGGNGTENAGPGYDEVTGLGTPVANLLVSDLASYGMSDQIVVQIPPASSTTAGSGFGLIVEVESPDGSLVTGASGTLTVSLVGGPAGAELDGTLTASINQGIATFSGLSIDQAGSGYALSISGSGFGSVTTSTFDVTPAAAAAVTIASGPPSSLAAGSAFGLTVDIDDAYGNLTTGYTGDVSLSLTGGPASGALSGTVEVAAYDGVATFSGLTIDQAGSGYAIVVTAAGTSGVTTEPFTVTPAAPAQLVIATAPPATVTAGSDFGLTVLVEDAFGNLETGYTGALSLILSGGPPGAALQGTTTITASGGAALFTGLSLDRAGTGYDLVPIASGLSSTATTPFAVTPAAPAQTVIAAEPPASVVAGTPFGFTVDVEDAYGNLATGYNGAVDLILSGGPAGAALQGTTTVLTHNGVGTFSSLILDRAGTAYDLVPIVPGLSSTVTSPFAVTPAAPDQTVIAAEPPASVVAGTAFGFTVDIEDAYGNLVTGYDGSVGLILSGGPSGAALQGTTSVVASGGVAAFSGLVLDQAGSGYDFVPIAPGLSSAATTPFSVTPAAPRKLAIVAGPPSSVTAGIDFGVTVDVQDAFGNLVPGYGTEVTLGLSGGPAGSDLAGPPAAGAQSGAASFTGLDITQAGWGYTIAASAPGLTGAVWGPFNVTPTVAPQVAMTPQLSANVTSSTPDASGGDVEDASSNLATIPTTGTPYAITITSNGLTPAATSVFRITRPAARGPAPARLEQRIQAVRARRSDALTRLATWPAISSDRDRA